MRLFRFFALCALVVGVGSLLLGFAHRKRPPNIIVVTIDTLRLDAVGHGTPAMDAFLAGASRYRGARTVAPLTLPAHVSLFSGLSPSQHGIHDNQGAHVPARDQRGYTLLAEELRDRGYDTAAFVSRDVLARRTGIAHGFARYDEPGKDVDVYVPAGERIDAVLRWIENRDRERPGFAWVHLFDPHLPNHPFEGDSRRPRTRDGASKRGLYLGEVRRVDAALERLFAAIDDDTIVVLVSDHGEGLGDHGELGHGPLVYGTTADILLAVRGPGFRGGAADEGARSIADVAATLRRCAGLPAQPGDGTPLQGPAHEVVVTESLYTWRIHGWGQCFAASDGRFTLIESGPGLELFDRSTDQSELRSLIPELYAVYERLDRALLAYRSTSATAPSDDATASSPYGMPRRPEQGGYLPRPENRRLRDPRAHLDDWLRMDLMAGQVAIAASRRDRDALSRALGQLDEIARRTPESALVHQYRTWACVALAETTGATSWWRRAGRAKLTAIDRGYRGCADIEDALSYLVRGEDREGLRHLLKVSADVPTLTPSLALQLAHAAHTLGLDVDGADAAALDRIRVRAETDQATGSPADSPG